MNLSTAKFVFGLVSRLPVSWQIALLDSMYKGEPPKQIAAKATFERDESAGITNWWVNQNDASNGTIVFIHGGGYIAGPLEAHWDWMLHLCTELGFAGCLIDYRLSRQAPFPAAIDDCQQVIDTHLQAGLIQAGRWALAGDSAGGAIALVLAQRYSKLQRETTNCLILASPFVDARLNHPEIHKYQKRDVSLTLPFLRHCVSTYAPGADLSDPRISPIEGPLSNLPPIIMSAGAEILLPDLRKFAEGVGTAGGSIEYFEDQDGIHAYPLLVESEPAQRANLRILDFIRSVFGSDAGAHMEQAR